MASKKSERENYCCGEKAEEEPKEEPKEESKEQLQTHSVPAILSPAPYWSGVAVVHLKLQDITLTDYKGKYLILFFYPYDFTFICPTEMIQFSDRFEEFDKLGCDIVAVSTDSEYAHLAWILNPRKQGGLGDMKIPVLSDKSQKISKMYGVLDEKLGISMKALFVIDKNQVIRHISVSEISLSRSVDETLRIVEACRFIDQYGQSCPAGPRESLPSSHPNYFSFTKY